MTLDPADRDRVEGSIGRSLTRVEAALFENLWSEHCAYRSSRPLLSAFETDSSRVVVGPGDDAAVVALTDEWYLTIGIESHNHPSYVDPYDGAATGVGGIVRDTLSMGAFPIALADCLFFGKFERDENQHLLEGVVEGIADYGNAIGVPTVSGSLQFHEGYDGTPLVNVACLGLVHRDRLVTASAQRPGNRLVIVGNATGMDGLGGASFASEELDEDAATEDRPAVQVGDPYAEKLLIEANEALLDAGVVRAARDLGAAGLGGATSELVAMSGYGAAVTLEELHQREPGLGPIALLLAESQERMCYEVAPEDVETVERIAERFDLGWADVGAIIQEDRFRATFEGEVVVDVPASLLCDGAPVYERDRRPCDSPEKSVPAIDLSQALETILADPTTASKEWVYRQYDHEVGVRTVQRPGEDAAVLSIREAGTAVAFAAGCESTWTQRAPYAGSRAVTVAVACNLATAGAEPIAAVDCLNGGSPEDPETFDHVAESVAGLADGCGALDVPVVGGNVSLYNESPTGPIPPTPTLAMVGQTKTRSPPGIAVEGGKELLLVGPHSTALGGSRLLYHRDGRDDFPELPADVTATMKAIRAVANSSATSALHDISHGGMAVTAAEMVSETAGISIDLEGSPSAAVFAERPGRVLVETDDRAAIETAVGDRVPLTQVGTTTTDPTLRLSCSGGTLARSYDTLISQRSTLERTLG